MVLNSRDHITHNVPGNDADPEAGRSRVEAMSRDFVEK